MVKSLTFSRLNSIIDCNSSCVTASPLADRHVLCIMLRYCAMADLVSMHPGANDGFCAGTGFRAENGINRRKKRQRYRDGQRVLVESLFTFSTAVPDCGIDLSQSFSPMQPLWKSVGKELLMSIAAVDAPVLFLLLLLLLLLLPLCSPLLLLLRTIVQCRSKWNAT